MSSSKQSHSVNKSDKQNHASPSDSRQDKQDNHGQARQASEDIGGRASQPAALTHRLTPEDAREGGRAAQASGKAHKLTPEDASEGGRKSHGSASGSSEDDISHTTGQAASGNRTVGDAAGRSGPGNPAGSGKASGGSSDRTGNSGHSGGSGHAGGPGGHR